MAVQDDDRELEQIRLFGLERPKNSSRSGVDALLKLADGREIYFELKTTTDGSVTTVRDFGYDHISKWKDKHWLISKYDRSGKVMEYTLYGSPAAMSAWIEEKEAYIRPDFTLANTVPDALTLYHLHSLFGDKELYTLEDAKALHKKQYSVRRYKEMMDVEGGYSPTKMLDILRDRCRYLIERGSTLNNPHIPRSYFNGWEPITSNHAARLKELVLQALSNA